MLVLLIVFSACTIIVDDEPAPVPISSDLQVHVHGAISGVPREGIKVSLHWTEEEAINNINPVAGYAWTDYDGNVIFLNLPEGEYFWIRAKALLAKTIRSSDYLAPGYNFESVPIL